MYINCETYARVIVAHAVINLSIAKMTNWPIISVRLYDTFKFDSE